MLCNRRNERLWRTHSRKCSCVGLRKTTILWMIWALSILRVLQQLHSTVCRTAGKQMQTRCSVLCPGSLLLHSRRNFHWEGVCTNCSWRFRVCQCMLESWGKAFAMKGNGRWLHHVTDRSPLPQCGVSFWSRVRVDRLVRRRSCEDESWRCFCHCR